MFMRGKWRKFHRMIPLNTIALYDTLCLVGSVVWTIEMDRPLFLKDFGLKQKRTCTVKKLETAT